MCKGKPAGAVVQTWQAGQTVNVQFEGSAKHGGVRFNRFLVVIYALLGNLSILLIV